MIMVMTREQQEKNYVDSETRFIFCFALIRPSNELRSLPGDTFCPVPGEGCSRASSLSTAAIPCPSETTLACLLNGPWGMLMGKSRKVPRAEVFSHLICIPLFFLSLGSAGPRIMNLSFWQQAFIDREVQLRSNLLTLGISKVKATDLLSRYGTAILKRSSCLWSHS